jgi:hypothetical protein
MANASDTSPYILVAPDNTLPNSRVLAAGTGLSLNDTGAEGTITVTPNGNLGTLSTFSSPGLMVYDATLPGIAARTLEQGTGIEIVAPDGNGDNPTISVVPGSTVQQINVLADAVSSGLSSENINFIPSGSVSITAAYNALETRTDITIAGTVSADVNAKYIIQEPDVSLPHAQALSSLVIDPDTSSGILRLDPFVNNGVVHIAIAGEDYQAPSNNLDSISLIESDVGSLMTGIGPGSGFQELAVGDPGDVLTSNGTGSQPTWQAPATGNLVVVLPNDTVIPVTLVTKTTYIATNNAIVTPFVLPATANPGDFYQIIGAGPTGWTVTQNAGQQITLTLGQTTLGTGHGLNSTSSDSFSGYFGSDSIIIYCTSTNNFFGVPINGGINTF